MALPIRGSWLSLRRKIAGAPERAIREPQEALAKVEAEALSQAEKDEILKRFEELLDSIGDRKKAMVTKAKLFLMRAKEAEEEAAEAAEAKKVTDDKAEAKQVGQD